MHVHEAQWIRVMVRISLTSFQSTGGCNGKTDLGFAYCCTYKCLLQNVSWMNLLHIQSFLHIFLQRPAEDIFVVGSSAESYRKQAYRLSGLYLKVVTLISLCRHVFLTFDSKKLYKNYIYAYHHMKFYTPRFYDLWNDTQIFT
jgi:hypothetical protein